MLLSLETNCRKLKWSGEPRHGRFYTRTLALGGSQRPKCPRISVCELETQGACGEISQRHESPASAGEMHEVEKW